jgi:hypothetical protein
MTLDELLLEWSYRSERGYPTLDNPSDVSILKEILSKLNLSEQEIDDVLDNLPDEPGGDDLTKPGTDGMEDSEVEKEKEKQLKPKPKPEPKLKPEPKIEPETGTLTEYDELIRDTFGGKIPKSKNSYNFSKNTFDEQVKADDLEAWKKLWTVKPKKKTGDKTETLGVGKGELSLYWLYNHSQSSTAGKITEGRGDDAPDLFFDGSGVEVKAYGKPNGVIDLGRFGKFRDNLKILNLIFGLKGLASVFDGTVKDQKQINALSWAGSDLREAFETVVTFSEVDLEQLYPEPFPIFEQFDKNIKFIESALGEFNTAEEGAKLMAKKFVGDKLALKPGYGGHLADMSVNGFIRFWHIDKNKFDSYDDILGKATLGASQGAMKLHFNKIFG